ncbi:exported hypothetical protein [Desulfamplus magnetovallimortis]|uniref:Peptidase C1A papain C-terminal domain-containing protein n=1 Tax=Desulfamplus magnetovallimortis TaxID=1246637 RepID=A0A1W1HH51_9BACT|nr:C1 family peptidase [Desulfamplus magnetovallimortis]SLM31770.1 exported hypothetical protein [Desulfamplus magnetovallimortis]
MKKQLLIIFFILLLLPGLAGANCATVELNSGITMDISCAEFQGSRYRIVLGLYDNPSDSSTLFFRYQGSYSSNSDSSCAVIDDYLNINVSCVEFQGQKFSLMLELYQNSADPFGIYWKTVNIGLAGDVTDGGDGKPVADSITLNVDSSVPYIVQQLSAHDPDNDVIIYELVSPSSGTGYEDAYINPSSGKLYLTHVPSGNDSFSISFRVTDGKFFSDPATVSVTVTYLSEDEKNTGKNDVDPEEYARFALSTLRSDLFGLVGAEPTTPTSVDLSDNFPTPGDQGQQNSCVGWATAYALKSYQEKVEIGWSLNTPEHLFSPAFLYNQINYGQDNGSYIYEALDLAVDKGLATLSTMPYSDRDYRTQPSQAAFTEASKFKAASWRRVNDTSQIKAALANGMPVVGGIAVYQQLMDLSGSGSVYNTTSGANQGGHAITIVGYDDNRYGGAFKVINSWGQYWGDNGYFWMPYNFAASGVMSEAYVLEDSENSDTVVPVEPTQPEPDDSELPNLVVESWKIPSYDPSPRGRGYLLYSIKNTGTGVAQEGARVALMLSRNSDFSSSDHTVVYEIIPELPSGYSLYRDEDNPIYFNLPDTVSGTYYMAVVVDPMNALDESREDDNTSLSDTKVTISNTLPDLSVNTWYAEWDSRGNGILTYEVINSGASSTTSMDWDINLILDRDQIVGNGNEIYLFYESAQFLLEPEGYIYRDYTNPAYFDLYYSYGGNPVPTGTYYMALWVDDLDMESESNELNNGSYSWGTVRISGRYGVAQSSQEGSENNQEDGQTSQENGDSSMTSMKISRSATTSMDVEGSTNIANSPELSGFSDDSGKGGKAYNGKRLPTSEILWKKVEISRNGTGKTEIEVINDNQGQKSATLESPCGNCKSASSRTEVIFPTKSRIMMK